jgi:hypothetical protein
MSRRSKRPLPSVDPVGGIPRAVMQGLADLKISAADRETYNAKLNELLKTIERNGET